MNWHCTFAAISSKNSMPLSSVAYWSRGMIPLGCKRSQVQVPTYIPQQFSHTTQESGHAHEQRSQVLIFLWWLINYWIPLSKRRYNDRHDAILMCHDAIHDFLASQLSPESITADLPNQPYSFPQQVVCTDSRPNIIVWDRSAITIIELTVPFELCVDSTVAWPVFPCHQSQTGDGTHVPTTVLSGLVQAQLKRACHQPCCYWLERTVAWLVHWFVFALSVPVSMLPCISLSFIIMYLF